MTTFRISGKAGDTVYSLPTIQALGGGTLYIPYDAPEVPGFYNNMHTFIESQGIECKPYHHTGGYMQSGPDVDYDLDRVRLQPHRGKKFMVQQYFDTFGIKDKVPERWVNVPAAWSFGRPLVNVTPRHRQGCKYDWNNVPSDAIFIGTEEERNAFPKKIDYAVSSDFLQLAEYVAGAPAVYCSQSSVLSLCQSMQIPYYCTFKPGKTNCRTYLENEHAL